MTDLGFKHRAAELARLEQERPGYITQDHVARMEAALKADRRDMRAERRRRTSEIVDKDGFAKVEDLAPRTLGKLRKGNTVKIRGSRKPQQVTARRGSDLYVRPVDSDSSRKVLKSVDDVTHVQLSLR